LQHITAGSSHEPALMTQYHNRFMQKTVSDGHTLQFSSIVIYVLPLLLIACSTEMKNVMSSGILYLHTCRIGVSLFLENDISPYPYPLINAPTHELHFPASYLQNFFSALLLARTTSQDL
jgi:hypothetical protein